MTKKTQYKVLSDNERLKICFMLNEGKSLAEISRALERNASTISREVRAYAISKDSKENTCLYYLTKRCEKRGVCGKSGCNKLCRSCRPGGRGNKILCNETCPDYVEAFCDLLEKPPYVCNACAKRNSQGCHYNHRIYDPDVAKDEAESVRKGKSAGYDYTDDELDIINRTISPLIKRGLSPYAALVASSDSLKNDGISLSKSTLYRMIERCDLDCRNIDLPEKVKRRRPKTKKRNHESMRLQVNKAGHLWEDYEKYIATHDIATVQMDCVEGKKTDLVVLLTFYWKDTHFQLALILDRHDPDHVVAALDKLETILGYELFQQMLPLILTDNGQEFTDIEGMERSCIIPGRKRTMIFFCDPNRSDQKGGCERNHREMRKIIPKGRTSLEPFNQGDINLMMDHVNSYPRESLYGKTPYEMASNLYPEDFFLLLGVEKIDLADLNMTPSLLKKDRVA